MIGSTATPEPVSSARRGRFVAGQPDAADQRIGGVDAFDLDQNLLGLIDAARHAADRCDFADAALASIQARSAGSARLCGRASVTSPPSSVAPWRSKLPRMASPSAPTPVITATPSAMQAMNT